MDASVEKTPYRRDRLPTAVFLIFLDSPASKEPACNAGDPWVRKIPWRRDRLPTPVFLPGEFHGLYGPWGHKELNTTEPFSLTTVGALLERKEGPRVL